MKLYLIGSLRNPAIPEIANAIAELGVEVFADWHCAGEKADDSWQAHETARGKTYAQALEGYAANHVFSFDKHHLDTSDMAVLVLPAGKSGHLELGYMAGRGKPCWILFDQNPPRWDVMVKFANVAFDLPSLLNSIRSTICSSSG